MTFPAQRLLRRTTEGESAYSRLSKNPDTRASRLKATRHAFNQAVFVKIGTGPHTGTARAGCHGFFADLARAERYVRYSLKL